MTELNWIAIIVTGLIYFGIHMLWYFPFLFGKKWLELVGKESEPKEKIIRENIAAITTDVTAVRYHRLVAWLLSEVLSLRDIISIYHSFLLLFLI